MSDRLDLIFAAFDHIAKYAAWGEADQVRSIMVCLSQLVDDHELPPSTITKLLKLLEDMAMAERG